MGAGLYRCWARGKSVWVEVEPSNAGAYGRCLNWMRTQGKGFKTSSQSARSPEEPAHSLLATAGSWEPHIESLRERRWVVGGGESAAGIPSLWLPLPAHFFEVLPRRAGSIRAPCARLESFPQALGDTLGKTHAGFVPRPWFRKTLGAARTRGVFWKPPLQASCGKAAALQPRDRHASPEEGPRP